MHRYAWARWGDVNAFFGLMLDNVAVMIILVSGITLGPVAAQEARFTPQFVLTRMIPGTALGVLVGDLVFTAMAFALARRTGRSDVTAMPLGLDTPSTFGVAFLVLLPALQEGTKISGLDHDGAMLFAWRVGVIVLLLSAIFKVVCAPFGNLVRRLIPSAGLLGSLAAIALALIAFLPLVLDGIAAVPVVGMLSLTVILITLVAHRALPGNIPGALAAVLLGLIVYLACDLQFGMTGVPLVPPFGGSGSLPAWQPPALFEALAPDYALWDKVMWSALAKLPVALPFALATIVGGIDCTESAAKAGDEYDTRGILLTEGVASLVAACLGGVIQTTPYIGHPAYKKLGGRAAYTLATALFVGAAGYFGLFTQLFDWLPRPAMFPILVFVGLEITAQSFKATPTLHYPALALAVLPALAALVIVPLDKVLAGRPPGDVEGAIILLTLRCLANGFIVTSLLWAASLAALLDGKLRSAAAYLVVAGLFAFFGVIHSPLPTSPIDLPWSVYAQLPADSRFQSQSPYHWTLAYLLSAGVLFGLSFFPGPPPAPTQEH